MANDTYINSLQRDVEEASKKLDQFTVFRAVMKIDGIIYRSDRLTLQQAVVMMINRPLGFQGIEGGHAYVLGTTDAPSKNWTAV